jgi:Flp pilus assembly pilin Flp
MTNLFKKLWVDDDGAVISIEFILVVSILIFGIIPGLVALRNSVNAALTTTGNLLNVLLPSFTYSGWLVGSSNGNVGQNVAQVNGYQTDHTQASYLTADQTAPVQIPTVLIVPPAP